MTVTVFNERPDAAQIGSQLVALAPRFAAVLGPLMQPERLIRTIMISLERTPKLYACNRQSIFNAAMSAACLGLEVDGATGQAYLLPFKGQAQLVIGYKGYNTLGARSGYSIRGAVVREGERFEFDEAAGEIEHARKLGNTGRIVGAWSLAASNTLPSVISVLSIDELLAVKNRAPGSKTSDSPWNDPAIGFPAMCEKTAKRRLSRSMPLNIMQLAARLDESVEELGRPAWIHDQRGLVTDGTELFPARVDAPQTAMTTETPAEFSVLPSEFAKKAVALCDFLNGADTTARLTKRWERDETVTLVRQVRSISDIAYDHITDVYSKKHVVLSDIEESSQSGE